MILIKVKTACVSPGFAFQQKQLKEGGLRFC